MCLLDLDAINRSLAIHNEGLGDCADGSVVCGDELGVQQDEPRLLLSPEALQPNGGFNAFYDSDAQVMVFGAPLVDDLGVDDDDAVNRSLAVHGEEV